MDLRDSLEEFGRMKGANKDEKGNLSCIIMKLHYQILFQILKGL